LTKKNEGLDRNFLQKEKTRKPELGGEISKTGTGAYVWKRTRLTSNVLLERPSVNEPAGVTRHRRLILRETQRNAGDEQKAAEKKAGKRQFE